jgi:hypothetical protein
MGTPTTASTGLAQNSTLKESQDIRGFFAAHARPSPISKFSLQVGQDEIETQVLPPLNTKSELDDWFDAYPDIGVAEAPSPVTQKEKLLTQPSGVSGSGAVPDARAKLEAVPNTTGLAEPPAALADEKAQAAPNSPKAGSRPKKARTKTPSEKAFEKTALLGKQLKTLIANTTTILEMIQMGASNIPWGWAAVEAPIIEGVLVSAKVVEAEVNIAVIFSNHSILSKVEGLRTLKTYSE